MAEVVDSREPMYLRIRHAVMDGIKQGSYPVGSMLPSENELASSFGTTRLTVRTALDELAENGVIRRVQGKGVFVAGNELFDNVQLGGFRSYAKRRNVVASVRILSKYRRPAGPYYAGVLGIDPADELYAIRRVNSVNGDPVAVENTLIPLKLFPGIEDIDVSVFSLYETYEMLGHGVVLAQEKLDVETLKARDAGLLGAKAGDLALVLECLSYDASGQPIEYARSLNRGDRGGYAYRY